MGSTSVSMTASIVEDSKIGLATVLHLFRVRSQAPAEGGQGIQEQEGASLRS